MIAGFRLCCCLSHLIVVVVAMASSVAAQTNLGRLAPYLPSNGQDGDWHIEYTGGSFSIANAGDPNAIRYYFVEPADGAEGRRTIVADLQIAPEGSGSAGLLYGLNPTRDVYHMMTLDAHGLFSIFRRDADGFRPMVQQTSDAFRPGKVNRLTLTESGDEVSFAINGVGMGSIGGDLFGWGSTGIAAVGDVRATFTFFSEGSDDDQSRTQSTEPPVVARFPDLRMKPVEIIDQNGPAGQMVAYHTLIPEGWKTEGGVRWSPSDGPQGCFTGARLMWGTGSPDEAYGFAILDPMSWGVANYGNASGCLREDLTDAEAAMQAYFRLVNVPFEIAKVERPPELAPMISGFQQGWQAPAPSVRTWVDGVVLTGTLTNDGRKSDGAVLAVTRHMEMQLADNIMRSGHTALVLAFSTPPGEIEGGHPAFAQILMNLRVNPQWQAMEQQWWQRKRAETSGRLDASIAAARSGGSIGDMMFESWKRREAVNDAGHGKSVNGIWEVQPWQTPSGGTVLLDQNYNHAWELENGTIHLTNDANFNPMQDMGQFGQEMRLGN